MKRSLSIGTSLLLAIPFLALAKEKQTDSWIQSPTGHFLNADLSIEERFPRTSALNDTTWLYEYSFDTSLLLPTRQGWTSHDLTVQDDVFFHVAGVAELDGGSFGRLVPLEGGQSLWCGLSPSADYCDYATLPGYGNDWQQTFVSKFFHGPAILLSYEILWDTEWSYDFVYTQYERGDGNWLNLPVNSGFGHYEGVGTTVESELVTPPDSARFRFLFTSDGAWSDEDGYYNTDGAVLIDSITVIDQSGPSFEDFEDELPGARQSQDWSAEITPGYGDFSDLFLGYYILQNRCNVSLDNAWGFFSGSTYSYDVGCGGNGYQLAVPMGNSRDQYIANEVWSPGIPWVGTGSSVVLQFDLYKDLPEDNLVFGVWRIRSWEDGCPGDWMTEGPLLFGDEKDWVTVTFEVGSLVAPAADSIQVAVGVVDMCRQWCGTSGPVTCHTHAPLIDNVRIMRVDQVGPQWAVRDIDLFQDTFPTNGTTAGTGRADAADNLIPNDTPGIQPRDEVVVTCSSIDYPLMTDPFTSFGPAAYCYVCVLPPGQVDKGGSAIEADPLRWPFVDQFTDGGKLWHQFRVDTSFAGPGDREGPEADKYCIDLNDNLFTPGDTILFVFGAKDDMGNATYWSEFTGTTDDFAAAAALPMEFQILPGVWPNILYVDDFDARGAQPYFETSFWDMGIQDWVDRYDVRGPSSTEANGPGGRLLANPALLVDCYDVIIWNSGDLATGTIGDGTGASGGPGPDKGNDFHVLYTFLDLHPYVAGLYISGDNVAEEWVTLLGADAIALRSTYMGFNLTDGVHHESGFRLNPLVIGEAGSMFEDIFGPDTLVAFGGCPGINDFDVLEPVGTATLEATYDGTGNASDGAVLAQSTVNSNLGTARVVLSGYSFHSIRDDRALRPIARSKHLYRILTWLGQLVEHPLDPKPPQKLTSRLYQNYRNPFNPMTTIRYSIKERGWVTLRIYNVAGQLVRTLVDGVQDPTGTHTAVWDGRNRNGQPVASGVYFYRLVTKNFSDTKKMVMLK